MRLFGPPDIESLKRKRKIKALIKALGYKKMDLTKTNKWHEENSHIQNSAEQALIELKPPIELLRSALFDTSDVKKIEVCAEINRKNHKIFDIIGKIGDASAVKLLINESHSSSSYQFTARYTIGLITNPSAVESLIDALKDKDEDVRSFSAAALGNIKNLSAVEPLIETLKDKDNFVRSSSAKALGKIKDPRAIEPLAIALKDCHYVHLRAAFALSEFKDPRAVEPLIVALKDKDEDVRKLSVKALGKIKDLRATKPLINELQNCSIEMYPIIVDSLCEINDPSIEKFLLEATWLNNGKLRNLLKRLGVADIEKVITKFEQIKRKEQEELIKEKEKASKLKEQNENEMIERMKLAGEEIAHLTIELIEIGKSYRFLSAPGGRFDENRRNIRAREIGTRLDQIAGFKLMLEVFNYVVGNFSPGSGLRQELEMAWNRIGEWQS
jgi:HEAT repeat protein